VPLAERWALVHYLRALSRAAIALKDLQPTVEAAEAELAKQPDAPEAQARVRAIRSLAAQRAADLAAIRAAGPDAGAEFIPAPEPRPEWETPRWPEPGIKP
jgi:hypothetical protein